MRKEILEEMLFATIWVLRRSRLQEPIRVTPTGAPSMVEVNEKKGQARGAEIKKQCAQIESVLGLRARFRNRSAGAFRCHIRWLIGPEVRAEIINQRIAVLRIDHSPPLDHLVHFARPSGPA